MPGNSVYFLGGCDRSRSYIFSFYFSLARKTDNLIKGRKTDPTPNSDGREEEEESWEAGTNHSLCHIQQVCESKKNDPIRAIISERVSGESNQVQTPSKFLWPNLFLLCISSVLHSQPLWTDAADGVRRFKLVPYSPNPHHTEKWENTERRAARDKKTTKKTHHCNMSENVWINGQEPEPEICGAAVVSKCRLQGKKNTMCHLSSSPYLPPFLLSNFHARLSSL